jgi:serine protease DegQ
MRRPPLYSASTTLQAPLAADQAGAPTLHTTGQREAGARPGKRRWWPLAGAALLGAALATTVLLRLGLPGTRALTQNDIDRAVRHTLTTKPLPAPAAKAYEAVRESVVKVIGYPDLTKAELLAGQGGKHGPRGNQDKDPRRAQPKTEHAGDEREDREERGIGTGVVILENGTILTNLHVVSDARRVKVVFFDGLEADADVIALRPEHDLAVLRARKIPDDLKPATMRSTQDLKPGDRVTAIGFPFGIGPSVTHGVVSGLKREFRSPEGRRVLTNLIQFDAAANPGNSGGPLVTDEGDVVGIVTAIYNPTEERFFVGVAFAVPIENAAQAVGLPPF